LTSGAFVFTFRSCPGLAALISVRPRPFTGADLINGMPTRASITPVLALPKRKEIDQVTTSWRDLADRLTPVQNEALERLDANPTHPNGPEGHRRGVIAHAQMLAMRNQLAATVAPPQVSGFGTPDMTEWCEVRPDEWERHFSVSKRSTDVAVEIAGNQLMGGTLRGLHIWLAIGHHFDGLDSAGAREVAADLKAAADELDGLSVPGRPTTS
jgi:hypothetical protein